MSDKTKGPYEEDFEKTPEGQYKRWTEEFAVARKFSDKWRKEGKKVNDSFLDERKLEDDNFGDASRKLNLFNSNITTMMSMLYAKTPKIDVSRTFGDADDDVARVAATMAQRILNQDVQNAGENHVSNLRAALQDRLIPGMGNVRLRYNFKSEEVETPPQLSEDGTVMAEGFTEERITDETVEEVYTHWQDVLWSPCRIYAELRWKAYRNYMHRPELVKRFGKDIGKKVPLTSKGPTETKKGGDEQGTATLQAEVWEIWSKTDRRVFWFVEGFPKILEEKKDPLELTGFWPDPPPMIANVTTTKYLPRSDYRIAQDLYFEIDKLQTRISYLTDACKVVGLYAEGEEGIKRIFNEGVENDLIPVANWAQFAEKGGFEGAIQWVPIEAIAKVIDILTAKQAEKIQQLYQVTGMADILRGASQPYEAAATSKAKVQFASIKIQALQEEFARFASDLQTIKLEIMQRHFQPYCWLQQSNIEATPDAEMAQQAIALLQDVTKFRWRASVKPEDLAMVDYAQLKQDRVEYIMGVSQFMQSSAPLMELDQNVVPFLLSLLKWGLAGFKGSQEVEGVMDRAIQAYLEKPPEPEKPDPAMIKAQTDKEVAQMKAQASMQENQQKMMMDMQRFQAEMVQDREKHAQEMQQRQQEFALKMQELVMEFKTTMMKTKAELEAAVKEQQAQFAYNTTERRDEAKINHEEREHAAAVQMVSDREKAKADRGNGAGDKK